MTVQAAPITRRTITREERDRLVETSRHNFAAAQVALAEGSRRQVRSYLRAMRDRIGDAQARRSYRKWTLQWLADAEYRTWEARRLGWKIP